VVPVFHRLFTSEEGGERPRSVSPDSAPGSSESSQGLISAKELPSAANALAELFPEDAVQEKVDSGPPAPAAPKKRNFLLRLFSPKPPDTDPRPSPEFSAETNASEPETIQAIGTYLPDEVRAQYPILAVVAPPDDVSISAEALPSASRALQELFPDELAPSSPCITDAPVDAPVSGAAGERSEGEVDPRELNLPEPDRPGPSPVEIPLFVAGEPTSENGLELSTLAELADNELQEASLDREVGSVEGRSAEAGGSDPQDLALESHPSPGSESPMSENWAALAQTLVAATRRAPETSYKDWAFDDKLASHKEWVESLGATGKKADLSGAELEATEMIGVNLRFADLHDANLRSADLLLADLRDACMVRADLEDACLVGANLEGANLEGASLETAMGLVPRQLAGANLRDALLAPSLMEFEAQTAFVRASQHAFRYFSAMMASSLISWLMIWKTRDAQLLTDSSIIPFLHSRTAAAALPTAESYLIVPFGIFILYIVFHFHLQKLWDAVQELPAIFPDGHTLGDEEPGIIVGLLRTHFRWMNPDPSSTRFVERGISLVLAYWIVPTTLLLFWARYLTRQEMHGTILQALLTVLATGVGLYATTKVGRPQERWALDKKWSERITAKLTAMSPVKAAAVLGLVLMLLSLGTVTGVPHELSRAPQYGRLNIRRWVPSALWGLGFDPYADLTEGAISTRPKQQSLPDDQVAYVDGARLNNVDFRYAQAYGLFLANAHLWRADFQGAFLSEADLRGADLGQSNLRYAVLDQARMGHVNLDRSNLEGADLRRADLREANLSYCSLVKAILVDARLDGASLYNSRLDSAQMTRADLEKADLRDSYLGDAHLDHVDFRGAYLWSAKLPGADLGSSQLGQAIFIDADLHDANLGGAQLNGTVLNGANLRGTSLEGTDLRGALGLTASQVCSSRSHRGAQLDPDMQVQVDAQCGAIHVNDTQADRKPNGPGEPVPSH
jgi:uncharacterized protein YjbI with pentapeptide repeats